MANLMAFDIMKKNAVLWPFLSCALFAASAQSEPAYPAFRWDRQFQLSGYYAVPEKIFARKARLDAAIPEDAPAILALTETPQGDLHPELEANRIKKAPILPEWIAMERMNPPHLAESFITAHIADNNDFLHSFDDEASLAANNEMLTSYLRIAVAVALLASLVASILLYAYRLVKQENRLRLQTEADIRILAFKDALTGLDNRYHFFILAEQVLKMAHRHRIKVAVLYIDLNNFKPINDHLGHKAGDEVLRQVGQGLRKFVRQSDIAARIGGDEFALLLYNISQDGGLSRLLKQIQQELNYHINYQSGQLHISASIGSAIYPDDGLNIDTLLDKADSRMYRIKNKGKTENGGDSSRYQ